MRYTISQHPLVESDLFEITDMISNYAGLAVGSAKTDEITNFIDALVDFPKIGTARDELYPGLRAIPASEKAVVCFVVDDNTRIIHVICISYAGSDWMSRIRDRL